MKISAFAVLAAASLLVSEVAMSQQPPVDINPAKHPNLAAAQDLSRQAWEKIAAAQKANEWDMAGHATKARDLLVQVNIELKAAAENANRK